MTNHLKSLFRMAAAPVGVAALLAALAPVSASAHGRAGVLECKLSGDKVAIIVEERTVDCLFEDESGAPPVHYVGSVTNVGAVIGVGGPGELAWGVVAASGARSARARWPAIISARMAPSRSASAAAARSWSAAPMTL